VFHRRRARILFAVLVLAALVLVTVDIRTGEDGPVDRLRWATTTVLRPIQDGLATLVRPIGDAAGSVSEIFRVRAENERLRDRVAALSERHRSAADLERENEELRRLLEMRDIGGFDTIPASTIGLTPSQFEWTVTLNVGTDDGVERGMPVIGPAGLVGRVQLVTSRTAWVHLAIDPNFYASARVARNGVVGVINGRGGDPMVFQPIDPEADIQEGDEIVTNQYEGGAFPGGVPIGTVASVEVGATPLTQDVTVRPFVDFTRLHHLLVVVTDPRDTTPPDDIPPEEFVPPGVSPRVDPEEEEGDDNGTDEADGAGDDPEGGDADADDGGG
jgi:rod shape-determining protein MreC